MNEQVERVARALAARVLRQDPDSLYVQWREWQEAAEIAIAAMTPTPQVVDPAAQLLRDIFEAPTPDVSAHDMLTALRGLIAEIDASPAVTWAGPGGVKSLLLARIEATQ